MQVIGLCRFSYPGFGGFQVEHESLAEREAYLYAPDRLEARFASFECFTLPALRAQTDPDFTFLIVIGENLPAPARARLDDLVRDLPQALVQARPPGRHRDVMKEAILSVRAPSAEPCLQFRLDDDDAVGRGFVEGLRRAGSRLAGLLEDTRHVAIDFNRGHAARPGPNGIEAAEIHEPFWTAGLGMLISPGTDVTVMNFAHNRISRWMPALSMPEPDMMVRGITDWNDSRQTGARELTLTPLDSAGEDRFRTAYGIDADHVRRVFGTARSR